MENCLLTQLKSSIANDNLMKLGEFVVLPFFNENEGKYYLSVRLQTNTATFLRVVGAGYFPNTAKEYVIPANTYEPISVEGCDAHTKLYVQNKDYYLDIFLSSRNTIDLNIFRYRNISEFSVYSTDRLIKGDLSAFSNNTILRSLIISRDSGKDEITGDISSFASCLSLQRLDLRNQSEIVGDLSSVAHLSLANFNVWGASGIYGSIENYIAKRRLIEPTGSMTFCCYSDKITWKGAAAHGVSPVAANLSWTNNTITWEDETINA